MSSASTKYVCYNDKCINYSKVLWRKPNFLTDFDCKVCGKTLKGFVKKALIRKYNKYANIT